MRSLAQFALQLSSEASLQEDPCPLVVQGTKPGSYKIRLAFKFLLVFHCRKSVLFRIRPGAGGLLGKLGS